LAAGSALRRQLTEAADQLDALHKQLVATRPGGWLSGEEELREKLAGLYGDVNGYEGRPTRSQLDQVKVLAARQHDLAGRAEAVERGPLAQANRGLAERKLPPIVVPDRKTWDRQQDRTGGGAAGGLADPRVWAALPALPWGLGRLAGRMVDGLLNRAEVD
jgi:hypothetical protein